MEQEHQQVNRMMMRRMMIFDDVKLLQLLFLRLVLIGSNPIPQIELLIDHQEQKLLVGNDDDVRKGP